MYFQGSLTVCSVCADAYHAGCHEPRITEKLKNNTKWLCINCQKPEQLQVTEIHPNGNVELFNSTREINGMYTFYRYMHIVS